MPTWLRDCIGNYAKHIQNIMSAGMGSDSCGLSSCSADNQHARCCVVFPMLYLHHVSSASCGVVVALLIWERQKQREYECWKWYEVSHTKPGCTLRHRNRAGKSSTVQARQSNIGRSAHIERQFYHIYLAEWFCHVELGTHVLRTQFRFRFGNESINVVVQCK
jgi:hypothetical protein